MIASSNAGSSVTWTLIDTGVMTISGSGEMYDVDFQYPPWEGRKGQIASVVVEPGVTKIGRWAFYECSNLTSVNLPGGVTKIGGSAFWECTSLTIVTIPNSVTEIGFGAFFDCTNLTDVYYSGTEDQWRTIKIGDWNDDLLNATIHYK